jgi:flagellin-like hook-associated protein FlgL
MPGEIVLSRGIRTNLLSLQDHSANLEISQQRLATGKRVNSALDNPLNFFQADNLRQRGKDLTNLLDQMGIAVETLKITGKAIEAVQRLAESAVGILRNAATTTDNTIRNQARVSFEEIKNQINQLVQDANFNGKNLLNGGDPAATYNAVYDLRISFNETLTTQLDVQAINLRATGLGAAGATLNPIVAQVNPPDTVGAFGFPARAAATDYDTGLAGDQRIQTDLTYLQNFISGIRGAASTFGINLTVLQNRQQFAKDAILTLNVGADGLTLADQNEEGAKLLALQTRQQLSTQALSLANQADQTVLRLFG